MTKPDIFSFPAGFDRYIERINEIINNRTREGWLANASFRERLAHAKLEIKQFDAVQEQFGIEQCGTTDPVTVGRWRHNFQLLLNESALEKMRERERNAKKA